jgi:uncharacterized protein (UPF0216 family)
LLEELLVVALPLLRYTLVPLLDEEERTPVEEDDDLTALEDELLTLLPELLTADAVERVELPLVIVLEDERGTDERDKVLEDVMVRPDVRVAEAIAREGLPGRCIPP